MHKLLANFCHLSSPRNRIISLLLHCLLLHRISKLCPGTTQAVLQDLKLRRLQCLLRDNRSHPFKATNIKSIRMRCRQEWPLPSGEAPSRTLPVPSNTERQTTTQGRHRSSTITTKISSSRTTTLVRTLLVSLLQTSCALSRHSLQPLRMDSNCSPSRLKPTSQKPRPMNSTSLLKCRRWPR